MMNSKAHRIYIIGMMASGKSTIGAVLAKHLGFEFIDMDVEIEAKQGQSIAEIFAIQGEEHFRKLETQLLKSFTTKSKVVISTGGGTPIYHDGMTEMLKSGSVVWLKVSKDTIQSRLKNDSTRPLVMKITNSQLSQMIARRNPIYKQADTKVWNRGEVKNVVARIIGKLPKRK